jgi:hypothetical protein
LTSTDTTSDAASARACLSSPHHHPNPADKNPPTDPQWPLPSAAGAQESASQGPKCLLEHFPRRPQQPPSAPPGTSASTSTNPALEAPLPANIEVEVRVDAPGFSGSWFEATVVDFSPARCPRTPARYTVTYKNLLTDDDGGGLAEHFAPSHIRPRPPPHSDDGFPPWFYHHP